MNRIAFLALAVLLIAAAPASAQRPADPAPPHTAAYSGGVTATFDVTYRTVSGYRPLNLDIYAPPPGATPRPLVIYVHGGNWIAGSERAVGSFPDGPRIFAELAARGYVVASIQYRLSGEAKFPAAEQDVKASIRFLRANAAAWDVDPGRVVIWGGSAGGQLAALAAETCGVAQFEPPAGRGGGPEPSDCVQAAVLWYPVVDLIALDKAHGAGPDTVEARYLGCTVSACPAGLAAGANPITFVDSRSPPTLIIHGTADRVAPFAGSQALADALKAKGGRVELVPIAGVDHLFAAGSPEANLKVGHEAMARVYAFLDETLRKKP